jgi:hypothetical protein
MVDFYKGGGSKSSNAVDRFKLFSKIFLFQPEEFKCTSLSLYPTVGSVDTFFWCSPNLIDFLLICRLLQ